MNCRRCYNIKNTLRLMIDFIKKERDGYVYL